MSEGGPAAVVADDRVEVTIARVLGIGAVVAVALLTLGVALMLAAGIDPNGPTFPPFEPSRLVADLLALRPAGFLWAGILVVIAMPIVRLVGEGIAFVRRGDRSMAAVVVATLVVIVISIGAALAAGAVTD